MINLDEINWNYLCEKYNEKNNQEDYDSAKKGLTTYLNTWNKLKTAWNSNRDNHLTRLRLYSSLAPEMSITYFLRYFNRGNWCLGWCNPGSNPKFLTVSRVKNYKQEIYNVDGVQTSDLAKAVDAFKQKLEPHLDHFINQQINSVTDIKNLIEQEKEFIEHYSSNQFLYKIIILNTIPANLDKPIQCPLLFTNSHDKVNILLDKLYIPYQFDQRIDLERFQFVHSFIMKFWNKLHEFNGNTGDNVENPNIVQIEFMSGVCADLYSEKLHYTKIKTTPSPATKNINDLKDYELKKAINEIDIPLSKSVSISDVPREIEYTESSDGRSKVPSYRRHREFAENAQRSSDFKCEFDNRHPTFIRRNSDRRYVECHHLIPMEQQENFSYSLDTEANIVTLCSNCHNQIHYGDGAEKLLERLYNQRISRLKKAGIGVSFDDLLKMYGLS